MIETPDPDVNNISTLSGRVTMKIQYLNTSIVRKMLMQSEGEANPNPSDYSFIDQALNQYFNHDLVLLPFFFDTID